MDEMQRWEILRLHIEDGITLTDLARSTGISTRTCHLIGLGQLFKRDRHSALLSPLGAAMFRR
ncbi:hypothetical protein GS894_24100 [Rhodococcus hoagii]|nr:hypothetical protein [Prescottella equi]NKR90484.1 hypothetical protein [Prescottella equi]NKS05207.1 hypothetical protein [Prescottella equi]NKS86971.1 hypothetical protein [Prescottella equi]NKS87000.1 hypothetical protein [Prescottella equi]